MDWDSRRRGRCCQMVSKSALGGCGFAGGNVWSLRTRNRSLRACRGPYVGWSWCVGWLQAEGVEEEEFLLGKQLDCVYDVVQRCG